MKTIGQGGSSPINVRWHFNKESPHFNFDVIKATIESFDKLKKT
jgi:hypothetical protein